MNHLFPFRKRDRLMCSVPVHSYCVNISIYTGHIPWVCPVLDAYYSPSIIHISSSFWRNIVPISGSFGNLQMSSCYRLLPMVFLLSQMRGTVCRQVLTARGRPLPHLGPTATHLISAMRLLSILLLIHCQIRLKIFLPFLFLHSIHQIA